MPTGVYRNRSNRFDTLISNEQWLGGRRVPPPLLETVFVETEADLPKDVAGLRKLESKKYIMAPGVSTASTLEPPTDGFCTITGENAASSSIAYTGSGTLFANSSFNAGTFFINEVLISAPTGKLFDVTGASSGSVVLDTAVLFNFAQYGDIDTIGFVQFFSNVFLMGAGININNSDGVTFSRNNVRLPQDVGGSDFFTLTGTNGDLQITSNFFDTSAANQNILNIHAASTVTSGVVVGNGFNITAGGNIFKVGSKTEKDPQWSYSSNRGLKNSKSIGSYVVTGNAALTTMTVQDQWEDLNLGGLAVAGSNIERFSLTNTTTGELTYNGIEDFGGQVTVALQADSTGVAQVYEFRVVVNGSPTSDNAINGEAIAGNDISIPYISPLSLTNGDTVKVQVRNRAASPRNVNIANITVNIS